MLTLDLATELAKATIAHGRNNGLKPLTVAVLDPGGYPLVVLRDDHSANFRPQIAIGKAASALGLGISSRQLGTMAEERPTFVASLAALTATIVPAAGGLLITDSVDALIGAIGVTGDTSDADETAALSALQALSLKTPD